MTHVKRLADFTNVLCGQTVVIPIETAVPEIFRSEEKAHVQKESNGVIGNFTMANTLVKTQCSRTINHGTNRVKIK